MTEELITQTEAARRIGISRQRLNRLIKQGRLRTVEIAGRNLVPGSEIEKYQPLPPGRPRKSAIY